MSSSPAIDLSNIDLLANTWSREAPHDQFDLLRRSAPVFWHDEPNGSGFWAITKHADVKKISRDPRTFSSALGSTFIPDQDEETLMMLRLSVLNMDDPQHTRYRNIVAKGFTPRVIAKLVEDTNARAARVVDEVAARGECEFVNDIASKVPIQTICTMLGLDDELWPRMVELTNMMISGLDAEGQGAGQIAAMEVYALCDQMAAARRAEPRDDIMTALVNAEVDGERLDDGELNMFFITLIVAGNETTRNLINHSMLALIDNPGEADRLRADESLWPTAVEEMLRYGTSIANFRRTATTDVELRGTQIKAGDKVVMYYASANRDEEVFADPHRFDVSRRPNDHVTFGGGGVHFCLGASLAKAQIRATMQEVVQRLGNPQLAAPITRLKSDFVNGVTHMPITFTQRHG
ncbi:MAG: cytochrome P450 [Actinobacteria bacterium]|nr:cytochrome P450 [Actinomycetota bacterium]